MGLLLGDGKAEYLTWSVTIEQMVAERFPGPRAVLDRAKAAGAGSVPAECLEELESSEDGGKLAEELLRSPPATDCWPRAASSL